jgi:apolipoprotein N-acyltransferase
MSAFIAILFWVMVAAGAFHAAYASAYASPLIILYLFALLRLAQTDRWRKAFYSGLAVGLLIAVVRLQFFWSLFSGGALALWLVYAFWIGLFVALARLCLNGLYLVGARAKEPQRRDERRENNKGVGAELNRLSAADPQMAGTGLALRPSRLCGFSGLPSSASFWLRLLGPKWGWLLIPFLWTGLEYFRSELYYLRFSWLNVGYAFACAPWQGALKLVGTYGAGFLLISLAAVAACLWQKSRLRAVTVLLAGAASVCLVGFLSGGEPPTQSASQVRVAGIQMEFPTEKEVLFRLNDLIRAHPETELVVLSEYTFAEPVPAAVKAWCRENGRYLIVGGKDPAPGGTFYNTAYVVGPGGDILFRQVKAVPIQFFKDGLPAPEQKLWASPWGKIGICICYDLSYTRVTDRLVQLGAEALIVPTMDVVDWGRAQHELHARIAPVRAAEYGLPIFRLASSGISQLVGQSGRVTATAPCPGDGANLAGPLEMRGSGRRPLDRWLAPLATGLTAMVIIWFALRRGPGGRLPDGEKIQVVQPMSSSPQNQLRTSRLLTPSDP